MRIRRRAELGEGGERTRPPRKKTVPPVVFHAFLGQSRLDLDQLSCGKLSGGSQAGVSPSLESSSRPPASNSQPRAESDLSRAAARPSPTDAKTWPDGRGMFFEFSKGLGQTVNAAPVAAGGGKDRGGRARCPGPHVARGPSDAGAFLLLPRGGGPPFLFGSQRRDEHRCRQSTAPRTATTTTRRRREEPWAGAGSATAEPGPRR